MNTKPLPITQSNVRFKHIQIKGKTLGEIAIIEFVNMKSKMKLCTAILLPADTAITLTYDERSAAYPMYFLDGGVDIELNILVNNSMRTLYATIICRSTDGTIRQQIHGLGYLQ